MHLKYAHLTDYATVGNGGKLTLVGLFANVVDALNQRPIPFPQFYLVAVFEAHVAEGTEHTIKVRFIDADGNRVAPEFSGPLKFAPTGRGRPLEANLIVGFGPAVIHVPELGDYEFRFELDGKDADGIRVSVVPPPG